jgi:DNA-damage-inducible protein J
MTANALVQARMDAELKERATAVLGDLGLTVSDVIRVLLTRIANEGALPFDLTTDPAAHDLWFRAKVAEALDDTGPAVSHDQVESHFAGRRAAALRRAAAVQG